MSFVFFIDFLETIFWVVEILHFLHTIKNMILILIITQKEISPHF